MELKIFRDTLPQAGTSCTVKAELPLETEILISDYLPPVFKLVKCFAKPEVLQKQLQPGRLTLEGYLRCTVFYQGEDGAGLCQTEQKLPFTKALELPSFAATAWTACVEGQTEYLNCRAGHEGVSCGVVDLNAQGTAVHLHFHGSVCQAPRMAGNNACHGSGPTG